MEKENKKNPQPQENQLSDDDLNSVAGGTGDDEEQMTDDEFYEYLCNLPKNQLTEAQKDFMAEYNYYSGGYGDCYY